MDIPTNLLPTRMQTATGFAHGEYFIETPPGITPAQVVNPDFWIHLAGRLKVRDRIEVVAKDGSFDMDIRVVAVDPRGLHARVRVLRCCDGDGIAIPGAASLEPEAPVPSGIPDHEGYVVEPDSSGWRVVRGHDLIAGKLPSEAAAVAARDAHKAGKPLRKAG